jgi:putative hydrolase
MIDLHSHTVFSDGVLIPSELARRAEHGGLTAIGITDHCDLSNMDFIVPRIVAVADQLNRVMSVRVIPGIEITHVPPVLIAEMVVRARSLGARLVLVHGETIAEPVAPGTNRAALEADIDVLAHPGLISEEDVVFARERGIFLEISARKGHSLTNGHVACLARRCGAQLVINTDSHEPADLISKEKAIRIVQGAGLEPEDFERMQANASRFL